MDWAQKLPAIFLLSAYRAGTEYAWDRDEALDVLSLLERLGFVVLGVDVWLPTNPGLTIPTPNVYDWDIETAANIPGWPQSAFEFVKFFQWHADDKKYRLESPCFAIGPVELRG